MGDGIAHYLAELTVVHLWKYSPHEMRSHPQQQVRNPKTGFSTNWVLRRWIKLFLGVSFDICYIWLEFYTCLWL